MTPDWALKDDCEEIENLIPQYGDGYLDPESARRVEAHLESCHSCMTALADYREFVSMFTESSIPSLKERAMATSEFDNESMSLFAENLVSGRVGPGTRLESAEIARLCGITETRARSLIDQLRCYDIAEVDEHGNLTLASILGQQFLEMLQLRRKVETKAVVGFIANKDASIEPLKAIHKQMEAIERRGRLTKQEQQTFFRYDVRFHKEIATGSNVEGAVEAILTIMIKCHLPGAESLEDDQNHASRVIVEHGAIISALEEAENENVQRKAACDAVELHLENSLLRWAKLKTVKSASNVTTPDRTPCGPLEECGMPESAKAVFDERW